MIAVKGQSKLKKVVSIGTLLVCLISSETRALLNVDWPEISLYLPTALYICIS